MSLSNSSNLTSSSVATGSYSDHVDSKIKCCFKTCFKCNSFEMFGAATTFFETGNLSCFENEREHTQREVILPCNNDNNGDEEIKTIKFCNNHLSITFNDLIVHSTSIDFMNLSGGLTQRKRNALVRVNVKCQGQSFDNLLWGQGAKKMLGLPNAGGASVLSEVLSCEVMERILGVELFKTEMEVKYLFINQPMTDYLVKFHHPQQKILFCLGVSVTRAYAPKRRYTKQDAHKLLTRKLLGVNSSTRNIINAKVWKQILHIWCPNGKVANVVRRAYAKLDDTYKSNTVVVLSVVDSMWVFTNGKT
ncbi:11629_t:CDS:2 [Ambispora leptoticha]|uniref:11629_t:CDS:1 n=1 Tax=Ambispora leptoticha TaxID=144679 RepID=A0A9N9FB20_9GLOM|nr:11629_t:CDS:2 [Ambispora leptoticha]